MTPLQIRLPGVRREGVASVPRRELRHLQLSLPPLPARRLPAAVALQLTQHMAPGGFAFVCRREPAGEVTVWAWSASGPTEAAAWPEPLLEAPAADGARLLRRAPGFELQRWRDGRLTHSLWLPSAPDAQEWVAFARGAGLATDDHPLAPVPVAAAAAARPGGWTRGDNLPRSDPWRGWRWQAALVALGCLVAGAAGMHLQTRQQLASDRQWLAALRSERQASLQARARHDAARAEFDTLLALAPRMSQLELLDRVVTSGIFEPATVADTPAPQQAPQATGATAAAALAAPTLQEWDFRGQQLRLTLELPEGDFGLLDRTRRLERVPGLRDLKVGQESTVSTLVLTATMEPLSAVAR